MPNNQFKKGELYSFITGKASTAIARCLQKKFNARGLNLTIEQWSVLYQLWKKEGLSQQELCNATFRDKPSITRLVDNLEKLNLVKRVAADNDRRINRIYLTRQGQKLEELSMTLAEETLNEALKTVAAEQIEIVFEVKMQRADQCPHCAADLHCCKNCEHWDIAAHNQCKEHIAEYIPDREKANFCTFFTCASRFTMPRCST